MTEEPQPRPDQETTSSENVAGAVGDFCREVVRLLRMSLSVQAVREDRTIRVNLSGADRPYLLSNAAAVLNSLEYLTNRVFWTGKDEEIASIVLDSDDYRKHREAELALLAEMASKKVLSQRKPLTLQPMTPRERRIVHLALASVKGVRSESDGEGDSRSITIYPS